VTGTTVIDRRRSGLAAGVGLAIVSIPVSVALALAALLPWSVWSAVGVAVCALALYKLSPAVLRLVDRIEVDEDGVRFRRLWSRGWVQRKADELVDLVLRARVERDAGHHPTVEPFAYLMRFADGGALYLDLRAFPGAERAVEALVRDERTGIAFPATLGGLHLSGARAFQEDPDLGRSVAYMEPQGTTCTVYVYDKGREDIGDGVGGRVPDELEHSKDEMQRFWSAAVSDDAPLEHAGDDEVRLGEAADAPTALRARFRGRLGDVTHETRLYLTGARKHFLKVRASTNAPGAWFDAICTRFLRGLGELVRA
jgi:hypothetical protein